MKLKKKKMLKIFFMINDLNPLFFELLIDSLRDFNKNLTGKNRRIIKLRQSNKTITLFPIYLNLFSAKKINTQKNEKQIYGNISRVNLIKEKERLLFRVLNKKFEPQHNFFLVNLYLSRSKKISTFQVIKSTQILQNLKMI